MTDTVLAILAGGLSRRYQDESKEWQDKILFSVNDQPFLVSMVKRSISLFDKTIISVNSQNRTEQYQSLLKQYELEKQVEFIIDDKNISFEGVMLGIGTVLRLFHGNRVQFLPSDRPYLPLSLLKFMDTYEEGVGILKHENGMLEPLLTLYGSKVNFPKQFESFSFARADVLLRMVPKINFFDIKHILEINELPNTTFSNINVKNEVKGTIAPLIEEDTFELPDPISIERKSTVITPKVVDDVSILDSIDKLNESDNHYSAFLWSMYFRKIQKISEECYKEKAVESLKAEYLFWKKKNIDFFALHSLQDLIYYFPEQKDISILKQIERLKSELRVISRTVRKL